MKKSVKSSYQVMYLVPELIYSKLHSCIDDHMKEELSDIRLLHSENTNNTSNNFNTLPEPDKMPFSQSETNQTAQINQAAPSNNETTIEENQVLTPKSSIMNTQNQDETSKFVSFEKNISDNFRKDASSNDSDAFNFLEKDILSSTPLAKEKNISINKSNITLENIQENNPSPTSIQRLGDSAGKKGNHQGVKDLQLE